jgi:hypothetical protein
VGSGVYVHRRIDITGPGPCEFAIGVVHIGDIGVQV